MAARLLQMEREGERIPFQKQNTFNAGLNHPKGKTITKENPTKSMKN
jgi:hypothetical protein